MFPDLTMLFPTFSLARGIALRLKYYQQSMCWRLVHHVAHKKQRGPCPSHPWSYCHHGTDP